MHTITFKDLGQQGRLGNQLFQIATTVACACRRGVKVAFPKWEYSKYMLNEFPLLPADAVITHIYHEPTFEYYPILIDNAVELRPGTNPQNKITTLSGYFQSQKYFIEYTSVLRHLFSPNEEVSNYLWNKYSELLLNKTSCSVHVRRGDYVNNNFYHQLDIDHYLRYMNYFYERNKDTVFLIFSDDINWCKESFLNTPFNIKFIEGEIDYYDLVLMSWCNHHIIANSSFSWWGAWLNGKEDKQVIFPSKWFGPACNHNHIDIYF
jgi:hypothetical protein